ncbi:uncharacterized protein [Arachis hypogaea]|uniref:uncharacterized protein n=1 Tax=Arachis hypogaea TaxID=3818 RepID=UPI003B222A10
MGYEVWVCHLHGPCKRCYWKIVGDRQSSSSLSHNSGPLEEATKSKHAKCTWTTKCSPLRMMLVNNNLSPEQREAMKEMEFGVLLSLDVKRMYLQLLLHIVEALSFQRM